MEINLSASAYMEIKKTLTEGEYLRVSARSGGCSGWKWDIQTEEGLENSDDDVFYEDDFEIRCDHNILHDVIGSVTIDYLVSSNLVENGFVFRRIVNPGHSCGCGESFTPIAEIHGNEVTVNNI